MEHPVKMNMHVVQIFSYYLTGKSKHSLSRLGSSPTSLNSTTQFVNRVGIDIQLNRPSMPLKTLAQQLKVI